jgi:WD40 repeat protein
VLAGHDGAVKSVSFSPDDKKILSVSDDKTALIWGTETCYVLDELHDHYYLKDISMVSFSPDSRLLASASSQGKIYLWDLETGRKLTRFDSSGGDIVVFSPDGCLLALNSIKLKDGTVRVWDVKSGRELHVLKGHKEHVSSISFSPDGRLLASGSFDRSVRVWDIKTGKQQAVLKEHDGAIHSVQFSHDGMLLASGAEDARLLLWSTKTKKLLNVMGGKGIVYIITFSPDGKLLASASSDGIRVWTIESDIELNKMIAGEDSGLMSLAFTPDSKRLISASKAAFRGERSQIQVWDIQTGEELISAELPHSTHLMCRGSFSSDSRLLGSSSGNNIWIWNAMPYTLFLHGSKPTPLYHTFIKAVKFLWQLDVQGLEIVETKRRTPADLKKYGTLLVQLGAN